MLTAGVARSDGRERGRARAVGEELGRLGQDLHQPHRPGRRGPRVELRLGVDDRRDQRRIEMLFGRLLADHVLVVERQPELVDRLAGERQHQHDADDHQRPITTIADEHAGDAVRAARRRGRSSVRRLAALPRGCGGRRTHLCSMSRIDDSLRSSSATVPSLTTVYVARCDFSSWVSWRAARSSSA